MPKLPIGGIIARLLASAIVVAGFYLLWLGFVESNALKALPGALLIPAGLYLMVSARRNEIRRQSDRSQSDSAQSDRNPPDRRNPPDDAQ